jgi:hypothetical protein
VRADGRVEEDICTCSFACLVSPYVRLVAVVGSVLPYALCSEMSRPRLPAILLLFAVEMTVVLSVAIPD